MGGGHPTLSTCYHIYMSFLHFFKEYILFKEIFVDYFSPIIIKNKSVSFLMKLDEMPYNFSSFSSSFMFSFLTSELNIPITVIFF